MISKFYYNPQGENVLRKTDLEQFSRQNPELRKFLGEHQIALRPIHLDEFQTMSFWIMGQIISNKVAHRMINTFKEAYPSFTPKSIINLGMDGLKPYISSAIKCRTILNLAEFFEKHNYLDPIEHTSPEIVKYYSQVKGVGSWTVKMLLIYNYGRLDILAIEDLGVRQGIQILYGKPKVPSISEARELTKKWENLATIGSLLAWAVIKE